VERGEAELRLQLEALFELADLAEHFPLLRPSTPAFEAWAASVGTVEAPTRELIDDGLAILSEEELERIVRWHAHAFPAVWRQLCTESRDELLAEEALLEGAIAAALRERRGLDAQVLELIEKVRGIACDPAEAIALGLDGTDVWSVAEAIRVDDALAAMPEEDLDAGRWLVAVEREIERLVTPTHEQRLDLLVHRVASELPNAAYPRASRSLAVACAAFVADRTFRSTVSALLMADALGSFRAELSRLAA
jgi:hypothetical protein